MSTVNLIITDVEDLDTVPDDSPFFQTRDISDKFSVASICSSECGNNQWVINTTENSNDVEVLVLRGSFVEIIDVLKRHYRAAGVTDVCIHL